MLSDYLSKYNINFLKCSDCIHSHKQLMYMSTDDKIYCKKLKCAFDKDFVCKYYESSIKIKISNKNEKLNPLSKEFRISEIC